MTGQAEKKEWACGSMYIHWERKKDHFAAWKGKSLNAYVIQPSAEKSHTRSAPDNFWDKKLVRGIGWEE